MREARKVSRCGNHNSPNFVIDEAHTHTKNNALSLGLSILTPFNFLYLFDGSFLVDMDGLRLAMVFMGSQCGPLW